MMDFTHTNALLLMEAAGIEPASENVQQESLHTCQVPNYLTLGAREPATSPKRQPVSFHSSTLGQYLEAILHKVSL